MTKAESIIKMLNKLLEDMQVIYQQGAGYYSCIPIARRYNKLLAQARYLFNDPESLINTFEDLEERDPKDPSDKMKVVQGYRIEIGQLISLLESLLDEETASEETAPQETPAEKKATEPA